MFRLTNSVLEGVVFANTPSYLYQRISAFVRTNQLTALSSSGLKSIVKATDPNSAESVAEGYIALLGLLQRGEDIERLSSEMDLTGLPWAKQIAMLDRQLGRATVQAVFRPSANQFSISSSTSSPSVRSGVVKAQS